MNFNRIDRHTRDHREVSTFEGGFCAATEPNSALETPCPTVSLQSGGACRENNLPSPVGTSLNVPHASSLPCPPVPQASRLPLIHFITGIRHRGHLFITIISRRRES